MLRVRSRQCRVACLEAGDVTEHRGNRPLRDQAQVRWNNAFHGRCLLPAPVHVSCRYGSNDAHLPLIRAGLSVIHDGLASSTIQDGLVIHKSVAHCLPRCPPRGHPPPRDYTRR